MRRIAPFAFALALLLGLLGIALLGLYGAWLARVQEPVEVVDNGLRDIQAECWDEVDGRQFYDCLAYRGEQ